MRRREFEENRAVLLSGVAVPKKSLQRPLRGVRLVGFDTEWDQQKQLLSVQFSTYVGDKLVSGVFEPPAEGLTSASLTRLVARFLDDAGVEVARSRKCRSVVLVAHFAQAELSMVTDAIESFHIDVLGKAHHASGPKVLVDGYSWRVRIVDLFAFFPSSLKAVGDMVGLSKLDEDRTDLARLKLEHPDRFRAYAARDAEIAVLAATRFRGEVFDAYGIDILDKKSLAALASEIFRTKYMTGGAARSRIVEEVSKRQNKAGEWRTVSRKVRRFDGDPLVRERACRSAWGARVEGFVFGLVIGPCVELDVVSQYPYAAIKQPLPTARTKWVKVTTLAEVARLEGLAEVEFRFPESQPFPSLPVMNEREGRLVFPRSGQANVTFAEIRAAIALGADVTILDAVGFKPGKREREHDLARYMTDLLRRKAAAEKGTLGYEVAKLLVNALVGKLWERTGGTNIIEFERTARMFGAPGMASIVARSPALRGVLKRREGVGTLFAIEWAALILGRARAQMASIIAKTGAYLVSTDAVIARADADVDCDGVRELRSVGSDLKLERSGDAVFIARSRTYAILKRVENLTVDDVPLAKDANWAVLKAARHGSPESKPDFAETVLACLREGRDVAPERKKTRLATAESAVRENRPINDEVVRTGRTHLSWDTKRRLLDRDVNPFRSFSTTAPFDSIARMNAAERLRSMQAGTARRRRDKRARATTTRVIALLREGVGVREVARQTGVPPSTVSDLAHRLTEEPRKP